MYRIHDTANTTTHKGVVSISFYGGCVYILRIYLLLVDHRGSRSPFRLAFFRYVFYETPAAIHIQT